MAELVASARRLLSRSIFVKLFLVFLATGLVLVTVIRGFFLLSVDRDNAFRAAKYRALAMYSEQLVDKIGVPPDRLRAERLATELGVHFRVATGEGTWATEPSLPPVSALHPDDALSEAGTKVGRYRRHPFVLVERNGVTVAVVFLRPPFRDLPPWSLALLLGVVGLLLAASYLLIRRLFRPVEWLTRGAGEIGRGNFMHQVPVRSEDELGRLTKAFNAMALKVAEMVRARDQLLLDVSHELRSPLTRMKVVAEFIRDQSAKENIQQDIRELEQMITELLESHRLQSDHGGLVPVETDVAAIVEDVVKHYAGQGPGVSLVSVPQPIRLKLDPRLIGIALRNVVDNALKHSARDRGPVEARVEATSSCIEISIRDHGPGIPAEEQARVFEPFYRVDKSRTRETGGYGLGLSLAKRIMVAHGGDIRVESHPGQGSTFTLTVPVVQQAGSPVSGNACFLWALLLVAVCAPLPGCREGAGEVGDKPKRAHLVETTTVQIDRLSVVRTRTGTLRARREVKIHAQEEGRITALPFYEGGRVEREEVVVRLDDALIRAQLTRASVMRKQAELDVARLKALYARKVVSEDEYTKAVTRLDVAKADERVLNTRLGYTMIRSPIDGVVTARLSEPGNIVERHQHVLTIADPSSLLTELHVSELIMPHLAKGDVAHVRIDALGDRVYEGRITRIHPSLDPVTRRGTIEVELQPVPAGAAPGQLCRVELNTRAAARRVIPFSALRRDDESEYVFVVDDVGRAQRVNVQSGLRLAEKVEIRSGLSEGQAVVTKGFLGLTAGKVVTTVNGESP